MAVPNAAHRAALKVMIAFWPRTALGIGVLQDDGETLFVPLKRIRTQRQKDKAAYRFYNQYEMPKGYATREITVRLLNSVEEEARRLNRAENLRAIPPEDPDFDRLYVRRGDAEFLNRNLDDSLYLKKAHSLGHLRQEADPWFRPARELHHAGPTSCPGALEAGGLSPKASSPSP